MKRFVVFVSIAASILLASASANAYLWGNLQWPSSLTATAGIASENIYGRIYYEGYTDNSSSPVPGITAEVGYGPYLSDPTGNSNWVWTPATLNLSYNFSSPDDEYVSQLTFSTGGTYSYTYRFSIDNGANWLIADYGDGVSDTGTHPFNVSDLGYATVEGGSPVPIPGAVWLLGSGLVGLIAIRRKGRKN